MPLHRLSQCEGRAAVVCPTLNCPSFSDATGPLGGKFTLHTLLILYLIQNEEKSLNCFVLFAVAVGVLVLLVLVLLGVVFCTCWCKK